MLKLAVHSGVLVMISLILAQARPHRAISLEGTWHGSCSFRFLDNGDCVPDNVIISQPYYATIDKTGTTYHLKGRMDAVTITGPDGTKYALSEKPYELEFGLSGNPTGNLVSTVGSTLPGVNFAIRIDHFGENDMYSDQAELTAAGFIPPRDENMPLYCNNDKSSTYWANYNCILFRKRD